MRGKLIHAPRRVVAGLLAVLVVATVAVTTAVLENHTPRPVASTAPDRQFSGERAFGDLERFASRPRPIGSPASDRTKKYLVERLRATGAQVDVQRSVGVRPSTGMATFGRVDNVVARIPGKASTGTVLLAAHYDSSNVGPGASDDGASAASILETVRALRSGGELRNDLVLLISDGEEDGMLGADAFAREHPLARTGGVALNWEARGVTGPSLMFETSAGNARLVEKFIDTAPYPRGDSSTVETYRRLLSNDTDFTELSRGAGFAGLNFAYAEGSSHYHTAGDSLANLDRGSLQQHGENMLQLTRSFGNAHLPSLAADHDVTYFPFLGAMISYSDALVWPLAALAVLSVTGLLLLARRRGSLSVPRFLLGAASSLIPVLTAALLGHGLWLLLLELRPAYGSMFGLLHRPFAYHLALFALAGLAVLGWYLLCRRRLGPAALAVGALVWPALLGVGLAAFAPGASYLFVLPVSGCALGGILALLLPRGALPVVAMCAGVVVSAALLPSFGRNLLAAMGMAQGAGVGAALLSLFGLTLLPIVELFLPEADRSLGRRTRTAVPLTTLSLVAALTALGLAVDRFDAEHPQRTHLAYVLNADTGRASWVSGDNRRTAWTGKYVTGRDHSDLPPGYPGGAPWTGPADPLRVAGPVVSERSRRGEMASMHVASRRGASAVTLRVDRPVTEVTARAPGNAPVSTPVRGTRANTWPTEIRFRDLPPQGVDVTLRTPASGGLRVTAVDESSGLARAPGFEPRPPGNVPAIREDGELIAVARSYRLRE